jgi:hypothetical protein
MSNRARLLRSVLSFGQSACGAVALSLFVVACSARATEPQTPPPAAANPDFATGAKVEVQRNRQWFPATVIQPFGDRFLIHYEGFGNEWNETVGLDRIRALPGPGSARDYKVGERVLVVMANRHAAAEITAQAGPTSWRVHFDGYGPDVGEVVGPDRLRRPFTGTSPHPVGSPVGVEFNGQVLGGKVLAVTAADKWIVRFPSFGPDYDQEVGPNRIRPAPGEAPAAAPPPPVAAAPSPPPPPAPTAPAKPEKPAPPAAAPPITGAAPLKVGDPIFVSQRGPSYLPATITGSGPGTWKVRYEFGAIGEDEVPHDRAVRAQPPLKGQKYTANQPVFIEWHGLYVVGKVLKEADPGHYKVRFEGHGPEADENVAVRRLRPR